MKVFVVMRNDCMRYEGCDTSLVGAFATLEEAKACVKRHCYIVFDYGELEVFEVDGEKKRIVHKEELKDEYA